MKFERRRTLEAGIFIGAMALIIIYNLVLGFRQSSLFLIHGDFFNNYPLSLYETKWPNL